MECLLTSLAFFTLTLAVIRAFQLLKKWKNYYNYWEKQNIPSVTNGNFVSELLTKRKQLQDVETECYQNCGNVYGRYEAGRPVLTVGNTKMLEKILVKDFQFFANRRDLGFHDPIMSNTLFFLEGDAWHRVRKIVSPTFTASKLRRMMILLSECCDVLVDNISEARQQSAVINCQQFFETFILGSIGRCAFGMNISALRDPKNAFVEKAKKLFTECCKWRTILTVFFPGLMKIFGIQLLNSETTNFYRNVMIQVLEERKNLNVVKDDFLQMLLDAEDSNNNGQNGECDISDCNATSASKPSDKRLSHEELLSQCLTFFIAGFEPTTSLLSHIVYRLAVNPNYQERIVEEIDQALQNHNGKVCYESLAEMKFVEAFMNECLRLCPAMVRSERRAEGDYVLKDEEENISVKVEKGMLISMPVYAMHHDASLFPEPEEFRPERFYRADSKRSKFAHLPFGNGPRICIGMRFVQMQVKLCLTKILLRFRITPSPTTPKTLKFLENRNVLKVDNVDMCFEERLSR